MGDKSENWCNVEPATTVEESGSFHIAECVQTNLLYWYSKPYFHEYKTQVKPKHTTVHTGKEIYIKKTILKNT